MLCGRGLDSSGSECGPLTDCSKRGNDPWGSKKDEEFLDKLSDYQFLKKESVPWSYSSYCLNISVRLIILL
jgi:hypothetical protein